MQSQEGIAELQKAIRRSIRRARRYAKRTRLLLLNLGPRIEDDLPGQRKRIVNKPR
jgi:hypothetical protein